MKTFRRFVKVAVMTLCLLAIPTSSIYAQKMSKLEKELAKKEEKETKERIKKWEKDGYSVANSSSSLEVAFLRHKVKLQDDNVSETEGVVSRCKSLNVGKQAALNNAQNALASELVAQIDGEVMSLLSQNENNISEEQDNKTMVFRKNIKIDLSGVLTESFAIYRKNDDGKTYEYRGFYLIDEDKKNAAVTRAVNKSLADADVALDLADKIRNHLNKNQE